MASDSKEYEGYSKLTQIQQNRKKKSQNNGAC
jgi:hypothetical protein